MNYWTNKTEGYENRNENYLTAVVVWPFQIINNSKKKVLRQQKRTTILQNKMVNNDGLSSIVSSLEHQAKAKAHLAKEADHNTNAQYNFNIAKNPNEEPLDRVKAGLTGVTDKLKEATEATARKIEELRS